ncbi:unnamed protein product [Phytophthora fragariaefolia]|uniref:Unnamed protein product n=1 Tax=Phytophthora fragariaefolia TaxID=1490495 RepID=A0A9W7CLM4_9STRA|nr:unnamed protein product [Phytophthora fragariaefolia]
MPKSNAKTKKAPRATEATPPEASPSAEEFSPKETTTPRVNGATLAESGSHATKGKPTKAQAPAATTAPSAKSARRTRVSKHKEVRLPGPYAKPAPSESDTDTPNPDLITGDEDSTAGSPAPRATKPHEGEPSAPTTALEPALVEDASIPRSDVPSDARKAEDFLNSSDSQDPKSSASATPPARAPPERSPPPDDGPDLGDYEGLEPDQDREQGEVPDPNSSPQLTEQQRVTHPGSPMTPKTAAAVARVEAQARRLSVPDDPRLAELTSPDPSAAFAASARVPLSPSSSDSRWGTAGLPFPLSRRPSSGGDGLRSSGGSGSGSGNSPTPISKPSRPL